MGWWQCRTTDEPNFAFGRAHVATAHTGQHVWFAGGLEVTGDGPQGNVIRYNQADPESAGHTTYSPKVLPSLRALADANILNLETGNWSKASLSSPRFGVSGAGIDNFMVFAGGAQLGIPDSQAVLEELTWQVNVSSCQSRCFVRNQDPSDWWCYFGSGSGSPECDVYQCRYEGCEALPLEKTAVNSDVVEVFDVLDFDEGCTSDGSWADSYGDSCTAYVDNPSWCDAASSFADIDGDDASTACCVCGGGTTISGGYDGSSTSRQQLGALGIAALCSQRSDPGSETRAFRRGGDDERGCSAGRGLAARPDVVGGRHLPLGKQRLMVAQPVPDNFWKDGGRFSKKFGRNLASPGKCCP